MTSILATNYTGHDHISTWDHQPQTIWAKCLSTTGRKQATSQSYASMTFLFTLQFKWSNCYSTSNSVTIRIVVGLHLAHRSFTWALSSCVISMLQMQLLVHVAKMNFDVMRFLIALQEIVTKILTEFSVTTWAIATTNKTVLCLHFFLCSFT